MDRGALDAAYNNTAAVGPAKRSAYVADWTRRSPDPAVGRVCRRVEGAWPRRSLPPGGGARPLLDSRRARAARRRHSRRI